MVLEKTGKCEQPFAGFQVFEDLLTQNYDKLLRETAHRTLKNYKDILGKTTFENSTQTEIHTSNEAAEMMKSS